MVGTNELPGGRLFHFGDVDGPKNRVKLQHCLGVAYADGQIYVADTYNNKIKVVNAKTGLTKTLAGTGEHGLSDSEPTFDEPAGLSLGDGVLYVADTNNHAIRAIDLATKRVSTLTIEGLASARKPQTADTRPDFTGATEIKLKPATVKAVDGKINFAVEIKLPEGWKANPLGRPSYWIDSPSETGVLDRAAFGRKKLDEPGVIWNIALPAAGAGEDTVRISTNYYYCQKGDEAQCKVGGVVFTIPLKISEDAEQASIPLRHEALE